ncbi:MAG: DUF885 domain-containing protein [Anaerolineae bacterium]
MAATDPWLDDFFASYYRHRPVNATFIGVHAHDDRLPDFSPSGIAAMRSDMQQLLARLGAPDADGAPSPTDVRDRQVAAGFLEIQLAELDGAHFQNGNPALYTAEAIFSVIALFLRDFAPLPERVQSAVARMEAIPAFLTQARANVREAPQEWTNKALRECIGARAFFGQGIDIIAQEAGTDGPQLRAAADTALAAFAEHQRYLQEDLLPCHIDGYAVGGAVFDLYMRQGHFVDMDGEAVAAYAERRFAEIAAELDDAARRLRPDGDWRVLLAELPKDHPSATGYLDAFGTVWNGCKKLAEAANLVTWPDYPLQYTPVPDAFRACSPCLYFLPYRSPAPFDPPGVYSYLVPPIGPDLLVEEQEARLRATNHSVIKLNHVVHHGALGHHVQNYNAYHGASRVGQIAAVDCASRIAMFCGGTMAEGWACYATDLMGEVGFYTPLEELSQLHSSLRQAARAVVDPNLHLGRFSFDDAVAFYTERVGMPSDAARAEVVKNSMFPGAAVMYLVGTDAIHALRREVAAREGDAFSLRRFHDTFLSYGSIPVALIAQAMLGEGVGLTM